MWLSGSLLLLLLLLVRQWGSGCLPLLRISRDRLIVSTLHPADSELPESPHYIVCVHLKSCQEYCGQCIYILPGLKLLNEKANNASWCIRDFKKILEVSDLSDIQPIQVHLKWDLLYLITFAR